MKTILASVGAFLIIIAVIIISFLLTDYIERKAKSEKIKTLIENKVVVKLITGIIAAILLSIYVIILKAYGVAVF